MMKKGQDEEEINKYVSRETLVREDQQSKAKFGLLTRVETEGASVMEN